MTLDTILKQTAKYTGIYTIEQMQKGDNPGKEKFATLGICIAILASTFKAH